MTDPSGGLLRIRLFGRSFFRQNRRCAGRFQSGNLVRGIAKHIAENFFSMLTEKRRALDVRRAVGKFDRVTNREISTALGMIDFDDCARRTKRLIFGNFLHRQDRAARDIELVQDIHRLELAVLRRPLFDALEDLIQARQTRLRSGEIRIRLPAWFTDDVADLLPDRSLSDEVDVGVGIILPAFALQNTARLPTT